MESQVLSNEELDKVAAGIGAPREVCNLNYFVYKTVSVPPGTLLCMQEKPGGAFMYPYWNDGDSIFVNPYYIERGYMIAYKGGDLGYVDAKYVK